MKAKCSCRVLGDGITSGCPLHPPNGGPAWPPEFERPLAGSDILIVGGEGGSCAVFTAIDLPCPAEIVLDDPEKT